MFRNIFLMLICLAVLITPAALAQEDEVPTIAFLRFLSGSAENIAEPGVWDIMQAHGLITSAERILLDANEDLNGSISMSFGGTRPTK